MSQHKLLPIKRSITRNEDRVHLGRLITKLQNNPRRARSILAEEKFGPGDFRGHVIGVTGVAGVGKSTFVKRVIEVLRYDELSVIVLAIDPTSVKGGWAMLGDRIRMRDRSLDEDTGLFFRSLASRGAKSSLTPALGHIIKSAKSFADIVIVETAGSGQVDTEIHRYVNTLVLLLAPLGDMITIEKAGQTEYAHLIVVNTRKGFDGNDRFFAEARAALSHEKPEDGWQRRVHKVDAKENQGIEIFVREGLYAHRDFLKK
jgi:LAO/AO transport system kinase